jgi:hypothetical protein
MRPVPQNSPLFNLKNGKFANLSSPWTVDCHAERKFKRFNLLHSRSPSTLYPSSASLDGIHPQSGVAGQGMRHLLKDLVFPRIAVR